MLGFKYMYLIKVAVQDSPIDGQGVFTLEDVKAGDVVWKFDSDHDRTLSKSQFDSLGGEEREELRRVAYLSKNTGRWVYPPENDPARFTNHSKENNLSATLNTSISEEPVFVANRDIQAGEELTNDYSEFDDLSENLEADWLT